MICRKCRQVIKSDEDYLHDGEDLLHLNCYSCSHCQRSLAGVFYFRYKDPRKKEKRRLLCEECYRRLAPVCFSCLKIIDEIYLIYGERIYHPNCFACHRCQRPFQGALLYPYENDVYCSNCYEIIQEDFRVPSSDILTRRCSICRKKFEAGELITEHHSKLFTNTTDDQEMISYIHNSCFVCEICHENLSNSVYYSPNNHDDDQSLVFQCEKCHQTSTSICYNCFQPSEDLMVIFDHRWYHNRCFQCKICHYHLKDLPCIISQSDGLLCERCFKSIRDQQPPPSVSNS